MDKKESSSDDPQKKLRFDEKWLAKIKADFSLTYLLCLVGWAFVCLLFSKPISLFVCETGGFLFNSDENSLRVYQWTLVVLFLLYLFIRVIKKGKLLWGHFPAFYLGVPLLVWYLINVGFGAVSELHFIPLPDCKYLDFVLLIFGFLIIDIGAIVFYYTRKIEPRKNTSSFIADVAIDTEKGEPDLLGFDGFSTRIANEIKTVSSSESVVFGINGQWGEGKTSMINLIRKKLKKEKYTVVDFHPWKTSSGVAVNQLFFDVLKDGLKDKIVGINWKIDRYAEALLQLDKTGLGKTIWQLVYRPDSVEKQKDRLRDCMKLLDKNLVVVVDDLDRLAKNEIADVLKLMRDTANFPNLVFLAAYDREYLNEAIRSEINKHNFESYMDKIVLWEAPIYRPQSRKYLEVLKNLLKEKLPEFIEDIDEIFDENNSKSLKSTYDSVRGRNNQPEQTNIIETPIEIHATIFTNLRTVKKFTNYLVFNIKIINDQIVFNDFYYLYLLRYFYSRFFDRFIIAYHELYRLKEGSSDEIETKTEKYTNLIFKDSKTKLDDNEIQITKAILSNIVNGSAVSSKSLIYYRNFLNYFHLGNHNEITMSEFASMLKTDDFTEYKKKVENILKIGNIVNLFNDVSIISVINQNFGRKSDNALINSFKALIWFAIKFDDYRFDENCHRYLRGMCDHPIYSGKIKNVQREIKEFILNEKLQTDFEFFMYLTLKDIGASPTRISTYLAINDVLAMAKENFDNYISSEKDICPELINLFYCSYRSIDRKGNWTDDKRVISIMKEKVLKQPDKFIDFIVVRDGNTKHSSNPDNYHYRFLSFLLKIFASYEEFISFLEKAEIEYDNVKATVYLKYTEKSFPEKNLHSPYPFLPDDNDYRDLFAGQDTLEILLNWKLRAKIDNDFFVHKNTK